MLRDSWYVACAASQLTDRPRAARILDQDLVVFRDGGGKPCALLDRCCHRGVKLSLGKVTDGNIACVYHGWQYDGTGSCVKIPSLPDGSAVPRALGVPAFPCVEQDSYLWVWMGNARKEPPSDPPLIEDFDQYRWMQGSTPMACSATMLIENQCDPVHPPFAHVGTHPVYFASRMTDPKDYSYEVRATDSGMVVFIPTVDSLQDPIPSDYNLLVTPDPPTRVCIHQRFMKLDFFVLNHIIPTSANTCRMEWLMRGAKGPHSVKWVDKEPKIAEQDRILLESAQPAYDQNDDFEQSVPTDFITMMVRQVVALANSGRWHEDRRKLPRRRVVQIRS